MQPRDPRLAESGATPAAPAQRPLCPSDEGRSAATACLPSAEPESPARDVKHRRARARSANSRGERRAQPLLQRGPKQRADDAVDLFSRPGARRATASTARQTCSPRASRDSLGDRADAVARFTGRAADGAHDHQGRTRRSRSRLANRSAAWTGIWAHPRRDAEEMRQAIDRDHQDVMLDALDARTRMRHVTPRAPLHAHLLRRRDSHAASSPTRASWLRS